MRSKIHQKMLESDSDYAYWHPDVQNSLIDSVLDALMEPSFEVLLEGQEQVNLSDEIGKFKFLSREEVESIFVAMIKAAKVLNGAYVKQQPQKITTAWFLKYMEEEEGAEIETIDGAGGDVLFKIDQWFNLSEALRRIEKEMDK